MSRPHRSRARESRPASPPLELPAGRLVLGLQPVREAIRANGGRISLVVIEERPSPRLEAVERFARDQGVAEVEHRPRAWLDRVSGGTVHQGVAAFAPELVLVGLERLIAAPDLLAVALNELQDPQNFGAVIRSAVGLTGAPVIWGQHAAAPLSPATFRASAGAIEHATLCQVPSLTGALSRLTQEGVQVIGLDASASNELAALDLHGPTVLVVGSEHTGLKRGVRKSCSDLARLPLSGAVDSLNASVATAIALYEVVRQRSKIPS